MSISLTDAYILKSAVTDLCFEIVDRLGSVTREQFKVLPQDDGYVDGGFNEHGTHEQLLQLFEEDDQLFLELERVPGRQCGKQLSCSIVVYLDAPTPGLIRGRQFDDGRALRIRKSILVSDQRGSEQLPLGNYLRKHPEKFSVVLATLCYSLGNLDHRLLS